MKKRKKRGFTMVELLGVITILGIISLICIPSVSNLLKKAGNSYYEGIEKNTKSAGIDYYTDNKNLLPSSNGETSIVYVGDTTKSKDSLVGLSYIDKVVDKNNKTCNYYTLETSNWKNKKFSYVIVIKENNKYKYTSCLSCSEEYQSEDKYCDEGYLPENNRYIKVPEDYYMKISDIDWDGISGLTERKRNDSPTKENLELRQAGIRSNDGKPITEGKNVKVISPAKVTLLINGKEIGSVSGTPSKEEVWNTLIPKLNGKIGSTKVSEYLTKNKVKFKLDYEYNYKITVNKNTKNEKIINETRRGSTYITLINRSSEPAGPISIKATYLDGSGIYYSSTPKDDETTGERTYYYEYNINHNNIEGKYRHLLRTTIEKSTEYKGIEGIAWINRGIKIEFSTTTTTGMYECSYDNKNYFPCYSGDEYEYSENKNMYVRNINIYGERGQENTVPLKIDVDSIDLKTKITKATGENGWYKDDKNKDAIMSGSVRKTISEVATTRYCTTTEQSCDPLEEAKGTKTNDNYNFKQVRNTDTNGIRYCYKSINNAGTVSETKCYYIKRDTKHPTCTSDKKCEGNSTTWTNRDRTIICRGTDEKKDNASSGLNVNYKEKKQVFTSDRKEDTIIYELKDNAGNQTHCTVETDVYVDKTPPTKPTLEITTTTSWYGGNVGDWTTGNVTVKSASTDTMKPTRTTKEGKQRTETLESTSGIGYYEYYAGGREGHGQSYTYTYDVNNAGTRFRAVDQAGNKSEWSNTIYVKRDNTPPSCNRVDNTNIGGWTNSHSVWLYGRCEDGNGIGCSALSSTKYFNNITGTGTYSPGEVSDKLGNTRTCDAFFVGFDFTPPTCKTTPNDGKWRNYNVTLTGNCSDTGGSGCVGNSTKDITQETNGHYYPPDVYDQAGNSGRCNTVLVNIDKTPPECGSCTGGSTNWKKGSRTVTCTPKDSRSGIRSGSASETWNKGTHKKETISYTAYDKAGNSSSCSKSVNVYIDNNKPEVSSIRLYDHDNCRNSFGVSAEYTVSDSGSGVENVQDYWGASSGDFSSGMLGSVPNRGSATSITSNFGTACYSHGTAATKGRNYYIKIYVRDGVGNALYTHYGTAQANG